ncbi:MAG: hypothetical protein J5900_07500 [Prevotella sp.]|nr:hypothetical protein [Prevotella sp.]
MKKNQAIVRMVAAAVIAFSVSMNADAQFGSLKGLANKAKKAVKEKVEDTKSSAKSSVRQQAESSVSESADVSSSTSTSNTATASSATSAAEPKREIRDHVGPYAWKKAKRTDWNYTSDMRDVVADMAYWCKRLRESVEKDDKSQLDTEALERLTTGRPSFDYADKEYSDGMVSEFELKGWQEERTALVRAAMEIRDGVELPAGWKILDSTDDEKAKKKEITTELHRTTLLKRYKEAAKMNRYKPAISGNNAWVTNLVKENFPEWGKVIASKINTDYKVNYSSPGVPKSRYHSAVVMCQDQGYKVLHYIQLSQPYKGGGKYGNSEVRYGGMKWSEAVTLVK